MIELKGVLNVASGSAKLQETTVIATMTSQEIYPDATYDGFSKVTVEAVTSDIDGNITPTNIKNGVSILGVEGELMQGYKSSVGSDNTLVLTNQDNSDYNASVNGSELRI